LRTDYAPLSDMRASAGYRSDVSVALLKKALIEVAGSASLATRITGTREAVRERVA
jgi:xanthine dehydrogenase small subunit